MTFTLIQEHIGKYYIDISQDKFTSSYKVSLSHSCGDGLFRSDRENRYKDMKKAKNYYNYLKREINKGNI